LFFFQQAVEKALEESGVRQETVSLLRDEEVNVKTIQKLLALSMLIAKKAVF
jgi:hypothetical protein